MQKILLSCSGQGSQKLMMGKEIVEHYPTARLVFEEINDSLGFDITKIMWGEDAQQINDTANAQVAIMGTSVAIARTIEKESGKNIKDFASGITGHSLGEYSALCIANSISLKDTSNILRKRGIAMSEASKENKGAMAAIIGSNKEIIEKIINKASQGEILVIANDNSIKQIVISGTQSSIERAQELSKEEGVKRFIPLSVSGAFHSPLMQTAEDQMKDIIANLDIKKPNVSFVSASIAQIKNDAEEIRGTLLNQITNPVRFTDVSLLAQEEGFSSVFEIGVGNIISGLFRQTTPNLECFTSDSQEKIEAICKKITE